LSDKAARFGGLILPEGLPFARIIPAVITLEILISKS
jgi:hypothetical protein